MNSRETASEGVYLLQLRVTDSVGGATPVLATKPDPVHLPCLHTRAPAELGWPHMRCPAKGLLELQDSYDEFHTLHRTLRHRPLPGINSTHMRWWFRDALPSEVLYGGRVWDAYKLWHPVDHTLFQRTMVVDPRLTSTAAASNTPTLAAIHVIEQFRCPANNVTAYAKGSTSAIRDELDAAGSDTADLSQPGAVKVYPLDSNLVLNDTHSDMHRLVYYVGPTVMQELCHVWEDSEDGLLITSRFILGGRTAAAAKLNDVVQATAFPPGELDAWTLHSVEEFGNLVFFLRDVYERYNGAPPPGRRR